MAHRWHTFAIGLDGPATEVQLFAPGWNDSTKGRVLFDDKAARAVLAACEKHGVDVMIDLEHLSLDTESNAFDPDARGWGRIEVRADGSCWLADIKWNADGETRLREKRQRYVSPAFAVEPKTNRVTRILNVAITALPATDNAMPLIAANGRSPMDPKLIKEALDALEAGDSAKALEILKALIASAAGAEPSEPSEPAEMAEGDPMDPEKTDEMMAASQIAAVARRLTGKSKPGEVEAVLVALSSAKGTASDLSAEVATLRSQVLSSGLRELIRDNPRKIASPKIEALVLASDNLDSARALVDALPEVVAAAVKQPAREADDKPENIKLTDEDREVCRLTGTPPEALLKFKQSKAAQR